MVFRIGSGIWRSVNYSGKQRVLRKVIPFGGKVLGGNTSFRPGLKIFFHNSFWLCPRDFNIFVNPGRVGPRFNFQSGFYNTGKVRDPLELFGSSPGKFSLGVICPLIFFGDHFFAFNILQFLGDRANFKNQRKNFVPTQNIFLGGKKPGVLSLKFLGKNLEELNILFSTFRILRRILGRVDKIVAGGYVDLGAESHNPVGRFKEFVSPGGFKVSFLLTAWFSNI